MLQIKLLLFIFFLAAGSAYAQHDIRRISKGSLPAGARLEDMTMAVRWTDSLGDNILIITKRLQGLVRKREKKNPPKHLAKNFKQEFPTHAHHYFVVNDSAVFDWKIGGSPKQCETESRGDGVQCSFTITDLNQDRIAEIWLIFKTVCVTNEKAEGMKVIMWEDGISHTMNGVRGGAYLFDENFNKAFEGFIQYAKQLWERKAGD